LVWRLKRAVVEVIHQLLIVTATVVDAQETSVTNKRKNYNKGKQCFPFLFYEGTIFLQEKIKYQLNAASDGQTKLLTV
jgi:hypothetical protein